MPYPPERYEICACCGTEFGYDDFSRSHRELRSEWLKKGGPWFSGPWFYSPKAGDNAILHRGSLGSEYKWLAAFDADQLAEMANELIAAYRTSTRTTEWDSFDALLHEWSESGWAALSPELDAAFNAEDDEVPLRAPVSRPAV